MYAVKWSSCRWPTIGLWWQVLKVESWKAKKMKDIIIKYPRTPHIQGSRLQPGDEDLRQRPFSDIAGRNVVLEEKIYGANSAISFTNEGELRLQSRGHYLTGGYRERHYDLMKQWGAVHKDRLYECWAIDTLCMENGYMLSTASILIWCLSPSSRTRWEKWLCQKLSRQEK